MSTVAIYITAVLLAAAALLSVVRGIRPGALADRTLGLDLFVIVFAAAITAQAARSGDTFFLPVVTVVALLAFVATVTIARYLEGLPVRHRSRGSVQGDDRV